MMSTTLSREMRECIAACQDCADLCVRCSIHCLCMGGAHAAPDHQTLLQDCADICGTAARFMQRNSLHHGPLCAACSEIARRCFESCANLARGDDMMIACAEACRRCAQACHFMANANRAG